MSDERSGPGKAVHVVSHPDGWAVIREGNKKNQGVHQSLELARKHAESMASEDNVEVHIHDDGEDE